MRTISILITVILLSIIITPGTAFIAQTSDNFSIGTTTTVQIKTFWDGTYAYWHLIDSKGTTVSYWTFPQVQSYKTQGGNSWQYEVPVSLDSSIISGNKLTQNYTLDSGSKLSVQFEEFAGGKIKMDWGIYGAYNRNYRIDFTSNSVPSNKANLNTVKKTFEINDNIRYRYDDIVGYTVSNTVEANKNFHQYIEVGNAYLQWKWIDPIIEDAATSTVTKTCTDIVNGGWCNLTSAINATSGTVTFTNIVSGGNSTFGSYFYNNPLTNGTRPYQISLNLSNANGVSNSTWVYGNGTFVFNLINSTNINTNINITGSNTTLLPMWFENISANNQTALVWVNVTQNFTGVQVYSGGTNYTYNNSLGGTNTFMFFDDATTDRRALYSTAGTNTFTWNAGGYYVLTGTGSQPAMAYATGVNVTDALISVDMRDPVAAYSNGIVLRAQDNINAYKLQKVNANQRISRMINNVESQTVSVASSLSNNVFYRYKFSVVGDTANGNVNGYSSSGTLTGYSQGYVGMWVYADGTEHTNRNEFKNIRVRKYASPEPTWATWGKHTANVYAQPQNHPVSENKTTSYDNVSINLTLTPGTPIQNIQMFGNWTGTVTATITLQVTANATVNEEKALLGYYYNNLTYVVTNDETNTILTIPITNTTFISSTYKGSLNVTGTNITSSGYNTTHITINSSSLIAGSYDYNVTIPYNNAPIVLANNQSFNSTENITVVFSAADNESNSLSCYGKLNGIEIESCVSPHDFGIIPTGTYIYYLNVSEIATTNSQWTNVTAIITVTNDDLILANQAIIISQNTVIQAEQAIIKAEVQALWGGMLLSGIIVIAWIRRKLKQYELLTTNT